MRCEHCGQENVWLPRQDNHITAMHPICRKCGTVKNVTGDRPMPMGYFINALREIDRHLRRRKTGKLTKVQMRLIAKRLEGMDDFEDLYWMPGSVQKHQFTKTVTEYTNLSEGLIRSFL